MDKKTERKKDRYGQSIAGKEIFFYKKKRRNSIRLRHIRNTSFLKGPNIMLSLRIGLEMRRKFCMS